MMKRVADGTFDPGASRNHRGPYTSEEIIALRSSPFCVLPNRSLRAQYKKCAALGIPRHRSLSAFRRVPAEVKARYAAAASPECRKERARRQYFRKRIRGNPEPALDELRKLARGHDRAEDLVAEGFAIMLRKCVPAAEAFKLAKAEVSRTSAQPFREQSFNPDVDYGARETGRQVARASSLRAARGEG